MRVMSSELDDRLITSSLPTDAQLRVIFAVVALLVVALVVTAPYAHQATDGTEIFVPAYAAAIFVIEVTTAAILLATFRVRGSVQLFVLALGYLLSGFLSVPWALTFPGVFEIAWFDQNLQSTAWIAAIRRIGFASALVGYAVIGPGLTVRTPERWILSGIGALAVVLTTLVTFIMGNVDFLPHFMTDARTTTTAWRYIPMLALFLYMVAFMALVARIRSTLDIWMCVVVFSLCVEILLISYLGGATRLSVGWWSGRFFGLMAAGTILLVLLAETTENYMRLARAAANERRTRFNRLAAMEALSASIAHEINQPLSSMVTDANAGQRWLSRDEPEIEHARNALKRIADEGYRADKIVAGIRQMFQTGAQDREFVDLKCVIEDAVARSLQDRSAARIEVEKLYRDEPKMVIGNAGQLLQVVANLLDNAVDAMKDSGIRSRKISIGIAHGDGDEVEVSISDTGPGVRPEILDRVFLPFVSTKPEGMGMGLMFCRSVVEAHGGRIWTTENKPAGAVFRFTLPTDTLSSDRGL
ncbi:histidine kinase [Hyphomicrobium nitrativorans NL23]|uniref:histidine kinase n=2 Tax=Hyphomicrobium TaxID=81 RepID=V5S9F8_9HYPH|nr:histidine kinase [Hyphomicrobium nitrativorans NL23]